MATLKMDLADSEGWSLVYDTKLRELHIDTGQKGRLDINAASKMGGPGSDALSLKIVDMFDGPTEEDKDASRAQNAHGGANRYWRD